MTGLTRHNPGQVLPLDRHPKACPLGSCAAPLPPSKKTGQRKGQGEWKALCPFHGYVVYDVR